MYPVWLATRGGRYFAAVSSLFIIELNVDSDEFCRPTACNICIF